MSLIANMQAAWRPHRDRWLAAACHLVTGQRHSGHGISARALCSAFCVPVGCIVAGAALASVASSDGVDDIWTRVTAQSFIPVDAKDIDTDQLYVRQVGLNQLDLKEQIARSLSPNPGHLQKELTCLAQNIYFEARSEPIKGKLAVAYVVMNRVASRYFPDTVCGVVQEGLDLGLHRCQFSWYCDGKADRVTDGTAWDEAMALANKVYWGRAKDPSGGALWYHADYVKPIWRKAFARGPKIGHHIFYTRKPEAVPTQVAEGN